MGLDASVRCRCFEEGKLKPGPLPIEDICVDEEGYFYSRKLSAARAKLDRRRYYARYAELEDAFYEWTTDCCEHEDGEICCERVGNWAGCWEFRALVEELGGQEEFPLLSELLPRGNGGVYPAEKARATLEELDRFVGRIPEVEEWALYDCESGKVILRSFIEDSFVWRNGPHDEVGMVEGKMLFENERFPCLETSHFKQVPAGCARADGSQRMRIICLETGAQTETFDSIGPEDSPKIEREFRVVRKKGSFLYEGKYWTAERIRRLLVASIETGNPIRWC